MELWNGNVYIYLNWKRQNVETKQIKSHVFSYNCNVCVFFINSDIFHDMLGLTATFKVS